MTQRPGGRYATVGVIGEQLVEEVQARGGDTLEPALDVIERLLLEGKLTGSKECVQTLQLLLVSPRTWTASF